MNKRILALSICLTLLAVSLLAGCASTTTITQTVTGGGGGLTASPLTPGQTTTITVSNIITLPTLPPSTINTTIIETSGTIISTLTVLLTGPAPDIPHAGSVGGQYGTCFNCHMIPAGHTGFFANESLCMTCHKQGAIILVP